MAWCVIIATDPNGMAILEHKIMMDEMDISYTTKGYLRGKFSMPVKAIQGTSPIELFETIFVMPLNRKWRLCPCQDMACPS